MKNITEQNQQAFRDFQETMTAEQDKLKKGLRSLVRKAAIDAESEMQTRESIELKNMEIELEKPEIKETA